MTTSKDKNIKVTGQAVLLIAAAVEGFIVYQNFEGSSSLIGQLLLSIWVLLPFIVFLLITRKIHSVSLVMGVGVILLAVHLFFVAQYFTSSNSTAALTFLFTPIYEFLLLGMLFISAKAWRELRKTLQIQKDKS